MGSTQTNQEIKVGWWVRNKNSIFVGVMATVILIAFSMGYSFKDHIDHPTIPAANVVQPVQPPQPTPAVATAEAPKAQTP